MAPPISAPLPPSFAENTGTLAPDDMKCFVEVELTCLGPNSESCDNVRSPASRACSDRTPLQFSYQNKDCISSSNQQGRGSTCVDVLPLVEDEVEISCFDSFGLQLLVSPQVVGEGGSFTVSNEEENSTLPERIECTILSQEGDLIQTTSFAVGEPVRLELGDSFGALQLEGCGDLTCRTIVTYNALIRNIGTVEMSLTRLDFFFAGEVLDFLERIDQQVFVAGQDSSFNESFELDICNGGTLTAGVDVEAQAPSGLICQDVKQLAFSVSPLPPPAPRTDCDAEVLISCNIGDGSLCSQVLARTDNCDEGFFFAVQVCNTGAVPLTITQANFSVNTNSVSFLGQVENQISPGVCTDASPTVQVDLCGRVGLNVTASIVGNPPNGNSCDATDELNISVVPLPTL